MPVTKDMFFKWFFKIIRSQVTGLFYKVKGTMCTYFEIQEPVNQSS
jgi:hypothetical protein